MKIIELFIKLLVKISRFSHCEKYGKVDEIVLIVVYFDINSLKKVNYSEILEREETTILSAAKIILYKIFL